MKKFSLNVVSAKIDDLNKNSLRCLLFKVYSTHLVFFFSFFFFFFSFFTYHSHGFQIRMFTTQFSRNHDTNFGRIFAHFSFVCRKREKAVPRFPINSRFIRLIQQFCCYTSVDSHSQLSAYQLKETHSTFRCKHVEQRHMWDDKTRAAYRLLSYV